MEFPRALVRLTELPPWPFTLVAAVVAVVAVLVAHAILGAVLRRATRSLPILGTLVGTCRRASRFAFVFAALQLVWQAAPDRLPDIGTVRHGNALLLIATLTWFATAFFRGISRGLEKRYPANVEDNLNARRIQTQGRVLARTAMVLSVLAGIAMALMTFPGARQVGASLLASAGVIGIVAGLAAKPVFSNLIAGLQIALAQPIRIDDVLIVKGEWGRVEEITGTYVVFAIWDERRMIVPLQWFIENPFENWTRRTAEILGTVFLWVDYALPMQAFRDELARVLDAAPEWDRRVGLVQVTDLTDRTMQLRVLVSARSSPLAFDLRCRVREAMVDWLQREYPQHLPQTRIWKDVQEGGGVWPIGGAAPAPAPAPAAAAAAAAGDAAMDAPGAPPSAVGADVPARPA